MIKNDRCVIWQTTFTKVGTLQKKTATIIYDWPCNYFFSWSDNLKDTILTTNTDKEVVQVVIDWIANIVKKNDDIDLYDSNNDFYWSYKIAKVKKNKSVSWKIDNTHLTCTRSNEPKPL
jgi:hypothetical protein